ncbi:MAG TPA: hypothetical protein VFC31_13915 [Candidatus Limnocylindria bacterium]|nr:hypothetical protein [Candidatus Limnocylindria bacterium]
MPRPAGTESEADETAALAPLAKVSEADANNAARDVKVDAGNGAILAVEAGRVRRSPSAVEPPSRAG